MGLKNGNIKRVFYLYLIVWDEIISQVRFWPVQRRKPGIEMRLLSPKTLRSVWLFCNRWARYYPQVLQQIDVQVYKRILSSFSSQSGLRTGGTMTRDILVVVTLMAVLVGSGESQVQVRCANLQLCTDLIAFYQITFSRSWVRGKNSGDDDGASALLSDYDETSGGSSFAREAKATSGLDMQRVRTKWLLIPCY